MVDIIPSREQSIKKKIFRLFLLLAVIVGFSALVLLVRIPGESESATRLGLSVERLALLGILLVTSLYCAVVLILGWRNPIWFDQFFQKLYKKILNNRVFGTLLILGMLGILQAINFRLWISEIHEPVTLAYYVRLQPVVVWTGTLCSLGLITIQLLRYGWHPKTYQPIWQLLNPFILISGAFLTLWYWVSQSRIGLVSIDDGIGWIPLGIPLLESQILLAWAIAFGCLAIHSWLLNQGISLRPGRNWRVNRVIGLILWVVAFGIWMTQPLKPNWFASEARPPNMESYPNSDASVYDITAQNLLLGEGFKTRGEPYTIRPLYGLLLAVFHKIGGLGYEPIIWMQVALLALIPVVLFAITTRVHNRYSGILAALLIIMRERNAINLGDTISDANAKLLMPFLPTALGALIFIWILVAWLEQPEKRRGLPLLAGGVMGLFMLIRPELGVFFPFVGSAALLHLWGKRKVWAQGMAWVFLGLVLALAPWIWRNYQFTGTIYLDSPYYRLDLISRRYQEDPIGFVDPALLEVTTEDVTTPEKPTPTPSENLGTGEKPEIKEAVDKTASRWMEKTLDYLRAHPVDSLGFIVKHFMNSAVQTVQAVSPTYPITYSAINALGQHSPSHFWADCCSLSDYPRKLPYWSQWDGIFHGGTILPLGVNLILIALGITIAWVKRGFIGLVPIFATVSYYLVNAVVRNSGGRYLIPVNWVVFFYLSIGLIQLSQWAIDFFGNRSVIEGGDLPPGCDQLPPASPVSSRATWLWTAIVILLLGSSLPIVERAIQPKSDEMANAARSASLFNPEDPFLDAEAKAMLERFRDQGGKLVQGFALYPRFHREEQMGSTWYFYQDRPYSRMDFYLSSPGDIGMVLPLSQPPLNFPHASQVLVFACPDIPDFNALAVVRFNESGEAAEILWRNPVPVDPGCPLPVIGE
jgi:hypothetical protein